VWLDSSMSFVSYWFRARHQPKPPVHEDISTTTALVERTLKTIKIPFGIVAYPAEHLHPAGCKPLRMFLDPSQDLCWIHNVFRMPELNSWMVVAVSIMPQLCYTLGLSSLALPLIHDTRLSTVGEHLVTVSVANAVNTVVEVPS
jgi:hypothetical protein